MDDAKFWDKIAPEYAKDPISNIPAYDETLDRIRAVLKPQHQVLELGCGTGSTALLLAGDVARYLGTDISTAMIETARAKLGPEAPPGLSFDVAEARALPEGPFDVILALNLLHLVRDLDALLARVYDALPSGGLLIAKTGLIAEGAWFLPYMVRGMQLIGKAPYVRSLNRAELEGMLHAAGFELSDTLLQQDTAPRLFTIARKP